MGKDDLGISSVYYDKTGKQILIGDLLKVYHFGKGNRTKYMFHIVVKEETEDFPVMALKDYYAKVPHYRLYAVANKETIIYESAAIIAVMDWKTKRKKIKLTGSDLNK